MGRAIITIILFTSMAGAQLSQPPGRALSATELASRNQNLLILGYQRYSALRSGREQEFAIVVCMVSGKTPYCPDWGNPNHTGLAPVGLKLDLQPGFTVDYREEDRYKASAQGAPSTSGDKQVFLLKVRAANHLMAGTRMLTGRLILRKGDAGPGGVWIDNTTLEEVPVKLPVVIVEHDATVTDTDNWPTRSHIGRAFARGGANFMGAVAVAGLMWGSCLLVECDPATFFPGRSLRTSDLPLP